MSKRRPSPRWIYVLHFDEPIAHARHYTGATRNLLDRLRDHILGHAARLTNEVMLRGITWQIGAILEVTEASVWEVEIWVKAQKNG